MPSPIPKPSFPFLAFVRLVLLCGMMLAVSCRIFSTVGADVPLKEFRLEEYGVSLFVPASWKSYPSEFYQLESEGSLTGYPNLRFEYRGLPTYLVGIHEKEQYARGWYDAFLLSYRKHNARFLERSQDLDDPEGSFLFIGEYEDAKLGTMIRFGILRFRGKRLHTLYYTAPKKGFENIMDLFLRMEEKHHYFPPGKKVPKKRP